MKKRIVSGVTATGSLTLGNYIGAIRNFVTMQEEYEMFIFVADLHALTIDIAPVELAKNRREIMALYLACGLNPQKATLFFQSAVHAHGMMNWLLENQTTIGELSRMTQFKDKAQVRQANGTEKIRTGLLTYPTLMAGDILLYQPNVVPVGADQKQHIELTRDIATRFNNRYGATFTIPEHFTPTIGGRILSLQDPTKKMSKSDADVKGTIFLLDDPEVAYRKIQKAVTDSEGVIRRGEDKPGVTNLLTIYAALKNITLPEAEKQLHNGNYGDLKQAVGNVVRTFLVELQIKYRKALGQIEQLANDGALRAAKVADATLLTVKKKLGLD